MPDGVEPLVAGPGLQLDFDEEDRERAADLELVLDPSTRGHEPRHDRFGSIADEEAKFGLDTAEQLCDVLATKHAVG